jgi:hypothetical protein
MSDIENQIAKMRFQIKTIGSTIDFVEHSIPSIIMELDWDDEDFRDANKILNDYEQLIKSSMTVDWDEFETKLCKRFNIARPAVKAIILAFLRNRQYLGVCESYANEYNIKEFQDILELSK